MKYAIVFSSKTGNTRQLAEAVRAALPAADCLYFGQPAPAALAAERLYVGFWTDKGSCDAETAAFLQQITTQKVFLFGTAGFGGESAYFERILASAKALLPERSAVLGGYMCQGRMPAAVRRRYEKMMEGPDPASNAGRMIENFDRALAHPDETDLARLKAAVLAL